MDDDDKTPSPAELGDRHHQEAQRLRRGLEVAYEAFVTIEEDFEHAGNPTKEDPFLCNAGPHDCARCHAHVAGVAALEVLAAR
jgi:hypothetical protein